MRPGVLLLRPNLAHALAARAVGPGIAIDEPFPVAHTRAVH